MIINKLVDEAKKMLDGFGYELIEFHKGLQHHHRDPVVTFEAMFDSVQKYHEKVKTSDTEAWQDNTLTITCQNTAYVIITSARYYAPSNIVCTDWANAPAQTANHCNNRLSCSINTAVGAFYGDPCWGSSKKLEV